MGFSVGWFVFTSATGTADASSVDFREQVKSGETSLTLCGSGIARYRRIIKVYSAALYRADCSAPGLLDGEMRLELAYFRSIAGDRFGRLADASLRETLAPSAYAALKERLAQLHAAYRSVVPGDRYALTYQPDGQTRLELNGERLETIRGKDFARAYFGLWLGPQPLDRALRDRLNAP
jgi:hypothetical protein